MNGNGNVNVKSLNGRRLPCRRVKAFSIFAMAFGVASCVAPGVGGQGRWRVPFTPGARVVCSRKVRKFVFNPLDFVCSRSSEVRFYESNPLDFVYLFRFSLTFFYNLSPPRTVWRHKLNPNGNLKLFLNSTFQLVETKAPFNPWGHKKTNSTCTARPATVEHQTCKRA